MVHPRDRCVPATPTADAASAPARRSWCAAARDDDDRLAVLEACLDAAGLAAIAAGRGGPPSGCRSCSATTAGTAPTSTTRCSSTASPDTCAGTASRTSPSSRRRPCTATSSRTARSPRSRRTSGSASDAYRVVDISQDLRPFVFERGFVQRTISGTWLDADLRIVMPKLRTDPTEFGHLCLSTLEGSTGAIDATFYAKRQVDFRSATMMLLDVAPPDFAVVDVWAPVADGPFGVMGCHRPATVRHLYAGADALAVDEVVLDDLGIDDPAGRRSSGAPTTGSGSAATDVAVDGDPPAARHASCAARTPPRVLRALGTAVLPDLRVPEPGRGPLRARDGHDRVPAAPAPVSGRPNGSGGRPQRAFGLRPPPSDDAPFAGPGPRALGTASGAATPSARALAVADSRSLVRSLFLASAVRLERPPGDADAAARRRDSSTAAGCTRPDRLVAWLDGRRRARRARTCATTATSCGAAGPRRSPPATRCSPRTTARCSTTRPASTPSWTSCCAATRARAAPDLDEHADGHRRRCRLAAAPFVTALSSSASSASCAPARARRRAVGPASTSGPLLDADPVLAVDGVDLAADVIADARASGCRPAGLERPGPPFVGDVRAW